MPRTAQTVKPQGPNGNFLDTVPAKRLNCNFKPVLPPGRVAGLLGAAGAKHAARQSPVVHFTAVYAARGAGRIAFEAAWRAAESNKRVLFLNAAAAPAVKNIAQDAEPALDLFLTQNSAAGETPFRIIDGSSLHYAFLEEPENVDAALFERLRMIFDLVIVHSEFAIRGGAAPALAGLADNTVIIAEAERTRIPVVKECRAKLEAAGGRVTGTVLNRRRNYIPGWLYFLLFRTGEG